MNFIKIGDREKSKEDRLREIEIKGKAILSCAVKLMEDEHYEEFTSAEKINSYFVDEKTIIFTGDFSMGSSKTYEKIIEYNGEKDKYTIILKPVWKVLSAPTTY